MTQLCRKLMGLGNTDRNSATADTCTAFRLWQWFLEAQVSTPLVDIC